MEINLLSILVIGFILGIKHAMEPDHVIAVSTMVSDTKKLLSSSIIGVFWGIGHTITLFIVGMVFIFMKNEIPGEIALFLEFAVGVMLVYLGIKSYVFAEKNHIHSHKHTHNDILHEHFHEENINHQHDNSKIPYFKSIFIGLVHGLSGSAAMILLTMTSVKHSWQAGIYIIIFGLGTISGMLLCTILIGIPFALSNENKRMNVNLSRAAGIISSMYGVYYMYDLGINQGLFSILFN
ncbi:sulfite exporter TauE/SafE [Clostridium pascui]|uniref:urease accessory protein UreH domain-containing protein n=1 Tax=Clostridium pascui TaxID=46609 RepID=UPI00195BF8FF|nr:sulfite exporter TauE/SafE family protein [Clostridium pascui]MBM7869026.1 sulfite exporter TauE/SafE [Clostridium pascui]